mgnify:CR=1 FL=1
MVYYNQGNVGIGTANPRGRFEVNGGSLSKFFVDSNGTIIMGAMRLGSALPSISGGVGLYYAFWDQLSGTDCNERCQAYDDTNYLLSTSGACIKAWKISGNVFIPTACSDNAKVLRCLCAGVFG